MVTSRIKYFYGKTKEENQKGVSWARSQGIALNGGVGLVPMFALLSSLLLILT